MRGKQGGPDTGYPLFPSQTPRREPSQALAHRIIWFSLPLCPTLVQAQVPLPPHTPPHPTPPLHMAQQTKLPVTLPCSLLLLPQQGMQLHTS